MRVLTALLLVSLSVSRAAIADPVDDYVRAQLAVRHVPGVSIAVVRDGRVVKSGGYGVASLELDAPATDRTVYEIGSISKQITANAVLLLRDDGRLGLDDPISKYVDGTPPAWASITIRHVLTHTAGLADFDTGQIGFSYRREYTPREFVDLLAASPLAFKPGERWNYTNAFPLLGFVVERASGQPYVEFVRSRIFEPLGLTSARFKSPGDIVRFRADGYVWKDGAYRHGEGLRPAVIAANGGVMMNVLDFAAWDIAVSSGRLLSPASLKDMTTPVRLNDGTTVSHGLGWFMDTFNGHRFGAHWGTTVTGHSAVVRRYDEGVTVIVLGNVDDSGLAVDAMSKRLADMHLPGVAVQGLAPVADPDARETSAIRAALGAIADVRDAPGVVAGLGARLPAPVRERLAAANAAEARFESLDQETVTPYHFNLDPAVVRLRRYRSVASGTTRYLTVRLSSTATVLGVVVED